MHGALSGIGDYIAKDPNAPGKLVFARDANGKIAIGPDGKATGNYVDASGKGDSHGQRDAAGHHGRIHCARESG